MAGGRPKRERKLSKKALEASVTSGEVCEEGKTAGERKKPTAAEETTHIEKMKSRFASMRKRLRDAAAADPDGDAARKLQKQKDDHAKSRALRQKRLKEEWLNPFRPTRPIWAVRLCVSS